MDRGWETGINPSMHGTIPHTRINHTHMSAVPGLRNLALEDGTRPESHLSSFSKCLLAFVPGPDKYGECPNSMFPSKDKNAPLDGSNDEVNNTKETPSTYLCWLTD